MSHPELPPELWGKIFSNLIIPREPILSVCKLWRDIALDSPHCWRRIHISKPHAYIMAEQVSQAFERSGSLLIELAVHLPSGLPVTATNGYDSIAKVVATHFHRVRSLRLSAVNQFYYALFLTSLVASLPLDTRCLPLIELIIRLHSEDDDFMLDVPEHRCQVELGRIVALSTQLKTLQIPAYSTVIPIIQCTLPSIRSLTLAAAGTSSTEVEGIYYSFISRCPSLESFIYTTRDLASATPDLQESAGITFNSLKHVIVSCPTHASELFSSGTAASTPTLRSVILDGRHTLYRWQSTSTERMLIFLSNYRTLTSLEIVELPMATKTWQWLFQGTHGLVSSNAVRFEGLESLSIDEHRIDFRGNTGIDQTIEGLNLPSLKRLHLRSITSVDEDAFCKFIVGLGSRDFDLILEDCYPLVQALSQVKLPPEITITLIRDRRSDDSFRRCWPHPYYPQRTFKSSDPFQDDSYLWDESGEDTTDEETEDSEDEIPA